MIGNKILIIFCVFSYQLYCQPIICNIDSLPNRRLYFIGEMHVDNRKKVSNTEVSTYINYYSVLTKYLVINKNTKALFLEAPVFFEYYLQNFLATHDTSYLEYLKGYPAYFGKVLTIDSICQYNLGLRPENIHAIDVPYKQEIQNVSEVLLFILYRGISKDTVTNFSRLTYVERIELLKGFYLNRRKSCDQKLLSLYDMIWESAYGTIFFPPKKKLYLVLDSLLKDSLRLNLMKNEVGNNISLFLRISESYICTFKNKFNHRNIRMNSKRDEFMFNQMFTIMNNDNSYNYIAEIGIAHLTDKLFKGNMASIIKKKEISCFSIILYFNHYSYYYPNFIIENAKYKSINGCTFKISNFTKNEAYLW